MPLLSYDEFAAANQKGGSIREDLLDFIENVSPFDTPVYNNLGQVKVSAGFVEYLEDTLSAASVNAYKEGVAATDPALTTPSRNASIVQNFQKHYHVSGRELAVEHAGLANMLTYQGVKAMKTLKTDIENALVCGTAVTGNTDTAPQFGGLIEKISTINTSSSGTTLTESVFNDLISLAYSYAVNLREVYCNMLVKRTINGFSTNINRQINAAERRQIDLVDVYDSEVGRLAIFKERYVPQAASKTAYGNDFIALDPDYFQVGWLRPIQEKALGLDGDRERRMLVGELTLVVRSSKGGVVGQDYVANIA